MKPSAALCLLLILSIALLGAGPAKPVFASVYRDARIYTVYIASKNPNALKKDEGYAAGSGFAIQSSKGNDFYILTVNHVVEKVQTAWVKMNGQPGFNEADVVGRDTF